MTSHVAIDPEETAGSLHDKLMQAGAALLPRALAAIAAGQAVETPQAESGATYARKIKPAEARIDWSRPAIEIDRQIRGLSPFPGAWFMAETPKGPLRVKALLSRIGLGAGAPGELLDDRLLIACGEGAVRLLRVQAEGRRAQDADEFLRGRTLLAEAQLS
jgi:methionyl-tRNA formyltransferase